MSTSLTATGNTPSPQGRVVVVTGAASGIGQATANAFLSRGEQVIGLDVRGGRPSPGMTWIACDVAEAASVAAAFARVAQISSRLDVVVNNAGVGARNTVESADDDEWLRIFQINVFGLARITKHALPLLRNGNAPVIVNVASSAAVVGTPMRAVYSASKGAVAALTRAMAADLLPDAIRVNAVFPGTVLTAATGRHDADPEAARRLLEARTPLGRLTSADEIAEAIAYLASPSSVTLTGAELRYDGGITELVNLGTAP